MSSRQDGSSEHVNAVVSGVCGALMLTLQGTSAYVTAHCFGLAFAKAQDPAYQYVLQLQPIEGSHSTECSWQQLEYIN